VKRTEACAVVAEILLRSITDIPDFARLLDDAGWGSLAAELRRKRAERPVITGVPKIDPSLWLRGSLR
jgi:hypothetical protein